MLSAIQHSSIPNPSTDSSGSNPDPLSQKTASAMVDPQKMSACSGLADQSQTASQVQEAESSGIVRETPLRDDYEHHDGMNHAVDNSPIHPFASGPPPSSSLHGPRTQPSPRSPNIPSIASFQPQQHQQLVKLKSDHGYPHPHLNPSPPHVQHMGTPDIVMTPHDEYGDDSSIEDHGNRPSPSPSMSQCETMEDEPHHRPAHSSYQERRHLVVDTSSSTVVPSSSSRPMASPMTASTPSTASLTPDSGVATPSSRRPSLRTMTATLPRSALQEETIAIFKQYRNLIPCAKCFSRNTIQRDGMSDGNLRFKCRPPVSMNLTCNKSYSESKIRNMIAGVVYGHTLPDSGTPTSATPTKQSSENILALAPPNGRSSRRPSYRNDDDSFKDSLELAREGSINSELQQSYEEMNINGGHPLPVDDRGTSRRPSAQLQHRRPSAIGDGSPMMDYEDATMPALSNHLQVPGTPPMENDDPRVYRSHSALGHRSITPTGSSSSSLNNATRPGPKLHHSHSHPNISQQRHEQYLEQQEHQHRGEHRGSIIGGSRHGYSSHSQQHQAQQQQQQRNLQRQVMRRESAHCHVSNVQNRSEHSERRFSHPAALQPSSFSSKFLSTGNPSGESHHHQPGALSSSPRSSPGHESLQQALNQSSTPQGGRYEESASYYQRRKSQPHPSARSYSHLPPPPSGSAVSGGPGSHHYDRRASEPEKFGHQHRDKYERSGLRQQLQTCHTAEPMRFSYSMPPGNHANNSSNNSPNGRHAYLHHQDSAPSSSVYFQRLPRDDLDGQDHDSLSAEETEGRPYAKMRQAYKRPNLGHSLTRPSSHPNLYSASKAAAASPSSMTAPSKDLDSVLPMNTIKLTCFPNAAASSPTAHPHNHPKTMSLEGSDAVAMKLGQSSKVVIEITQPRHLQAFEPSRSASFAAFENVPRPLVRHRQLRHAVSQPNLLTQPSASVLGRRRSVSPSLMDEEEGMSFGSSKKRRADSDSISLGSRDDEDRAPKVNIIEHASASSVTVAEAAAAVVVAAANAAGGLQIVGLDDADNNRSKETLGQKEVGLGLRVPSSSLSLAPASAITERSLVESPTIEALSVAKASSYVALEDQRELGIDYSLFTRVETAGWRILIPPNVTASFRSEDFGLTLKPKAVEDISSSFTVVHDSQEKDIARAKEAQDLVQVQIGSDRMIKEADQDQQLANEDEEMEEQRAMETTTPAALATEMSSDDDRALEGSEAGEDMLEDTAMDSKTMTGQAEQVDELSNE